MKHRGLLVAAGLVVLLLVGGLVWSLRSDPTRPAAGDGPARTASPEPGGAPAVAATPSRPAAEPTRPGPERPVRLPPAWAGGDGGVTVRDHRIIEGRPAPPSPIVPTTIAEARQVIEPAVRACTRDLQLSVPARIVVHATLRAAQSRISAHEVTITGDAALGDEARACIIKAYQEFQTDMLPEQTDGEDLVHIPWSLP